MIALCPDATGIFKLGYIQLVRDTMKILKMTFHYFFFSVKAYFMTVKNLIMNFP